MESDHWLKRKKYCLISLLDYSCIVKVLELDHISDVSTCFQDWNLDASKVPVEGMQKGTLNYQYAEQSHKTERSVSLNIKEYKMYCNRNTLS